MSLYYLIRAGASERITGRDGDPTLYTNQTAAAVAADEMSQRLPFPVEHISVDDWMGQFHAPVVAAKRAIGSRSATSGKRALEILRELYDADDLPNSLDGEVGDLLRGLDG